ncbi:MAG: UvrD-helicase domain-containing protein [Bacteroidota bacterium]|nr:UvrD-helicase domain-containing protein [Bacteroidota bacterium]
MGLTVYKASAGSGKTYTMATEIIAVLLKHPDEYKNILAATFTNKAAGELKTRVINVLGLISQGNDEKGYFKTIKDKTGFSDQKIKNNAQHALKKILHDYSRFSVSTIDRFFNKILSSFLYEVNIRPGSEISLDDEVLRKEAIDRLLSGFDVDTKLGKWLMNYARLNILDEKSWNIRGNLEAESQTITSEGFLSRENTLEQFIQDRTKLENYRNEVLGILKKHEAAMISIGEQAKQSVRDNGYSINDFSGKMSGPVGFLLSLTSKKFRDITAKAEKAVDDPLLCLKKDRQSDETLVQFVTNNIHHLLVKAINYLKDNEKEYFTAKVIYANINTFGVLLDINHELRTLCSERQVYFIFQMSQLLYDIVSFDNALWVYEKMGTRYKHYFLDEFQDTSRMQWDIIKPLIEESLGSGGSNFIVGDVKQSVYRWRNGDWTLLSKEVERHFPQSVAKSLDWNFRSRRDVVRFNNHLMSALLPVFQQDIDSQLNPDNKPGFDLSDLYDAYIQKPQKTAYPHGYVKVDFLDQDDNHDDVGEKAMESMIREMKILMDKGYSPGDMAVLVNKNDEGGRIAQRLMEENRQSNYDFPVVSPASLYLKENSLIQIILSGLTWIDQPDNHIALAQLVYTYQSEIRNNKDYAPVSEEEAKSDLISEMQQDLPRAFIQAVKNNVAGWPLYDLTENIIQWFGLHHHSEAFAYLNAFQDHVLQFSQHNPVEISGFLNWFDKKAPRLEMPDAAGSIVISTIHKAKGLEFRFVFMPFTDWDISKRGKGNRIWVAPKTSPFDKLPLMIVNADSKLEKSHFSEDYRTEKYNQYVDMLNKFYVAITRAEEGLYIWAPQKTGQAAHMNKFLLTAMEYAGSSEDTEQLQDWHACYNREKLCFERGDIPPCKPDTSKHKHAFFLLDEYPLNMPEHNMRYHHPGAFLNLEQDETIRNKTTQGSVCHALLENVRTIDDLGDAKEQMIRSGRITHEDAANLEQLLYKAMQQEPVKSWFRPGITVINEQEMLMPEGRFIKPDRVLIEEQKAVVIDYKFGKRHNKQHADQVREYMQELTKMGYKEVIGYIWYVFAGDVYEVQ